MSGFTRRELLARAVLFGGGAVVALHWPRAARAAAESTKPTVLSAQEWKTVEAMTARIIPSGDGSPGARETVRTHTLLGFLSDPKYGGNRNFVGWKLTGYPGPRHVHGGYTPGQLLGKAPIRAVWGEDV